MDILLSGVLLNIVNQRQVVIIGKAVSAGRSRDKLNVESLSRLADRDIEVKNPNSQGMLLKL